MKKFKLFLFAFYALLFSIVVFSGCEIGMGEEVDLESPVIVITAPKSLEKVHLSFLLEGTCTDNIGVTEVIVKNFNTDVQYGKANINGNKWSFPIELTPADEGEITLQVIGNDAAGNSSTKSIKRITLLVDDTKPESQDWYIDKGNGITIKFYSKDYLQRIEDNKEVESSINKDIPQNESFAIQGKVKDAMSIKEVTLILKDDKGKEIISKTEEGSYTPTFNFTHEELCNADLSLSTGQHNLQASFICMDEHENEISQDLGWFLWWPESDLPRINFKSEINSVIKNAIPIDYFDDDEVAEVKIALRNTIDVTAEELVTNETKRNSVFDSSNKVENNDDPAGILRKEHVKSVESYKLRGIREDTYNIPASDLEVAANMKLAVYLKDVNGKENAYIIPVYITDGQIPLLTIETPKDNTIPDVETPGSTVFQINGYALDKRANPGKVYSLFIKNDVATDQSRRDNITKKIFTELSETDVKYNELYPAQARELSTDQLDTIKSNNSGKITLEDYGTLKWQVCNREKPFTDSSGEGWKQNQFTLEYNLVTEMKEEGKKNKYFALLYVDINGKYTQKTLQLQGDTKLPIIKITAKYGDTILKDMDTINPKDGKNLVISFTASKDTGLGIKNESMKITYTDGTENGVVNSGNSITLNQSKLEELQSKNKNPRFTCYAEDVLGNSQEGIINLVLSNLPKVTEITTEHESGTFKKGETLKFQVLFDAPVKVTGEPRLKFSAPSGKYATYSRGSTTATLEFAYEVPSNISCDKVTFPITDYIDLNGGKIEIEDLGTGDAILSDLNADKILSGKDLKIDSVSPTLNSITVTSTGPKNDSTTYAKADETITAIIQASENLSIVNTPTLVLKSGTTDLSFIFQGLSGKQLTFVHKVESSSPNGTVNLTNATIFSSLENITDTIGNALESKNITTKNVNSIIIDTTPPATPILKLVEYGTSNEANLTSGTKNKAQKLRFKNPETNAQVLYSLNGGSSWNKFTDKYTGGTLEIDLPAGESSITAKQVDIAGNESESPSAVEINIQDTFPKVSSINITNGNGYYKAGNIIFNITFEDTVKLTDNNAKLIFSDYNGNGEYEAKLTVAPSGTKTLVATYAINNTVEINGIKVKSLSVADGKFVDNYGNKPNSDYLGAYLKDDYGYRKNVVIDNKAPTVASYLPLQNGVQTTSGEDFTIKLTFSEDVFTESGYVTLQRIGLNNTTDKDNWAIPAVLSYDEFKTIYNSESITDSDRQTLMNTKVNADLTTEVLKTNVARPLGPYMTYTHGLNTDGSPDTTTKIVLAPEHNIFGTSGTTENIRTVLAKTGYHQHKVDIKSSNVTVSGNIVTIKFGEKIPEGQHWAVIMDSTCIRDAAQNNFTGFSDVTKYNFWSKQVAQPIIRVDRYSHNIGADEPKFPSSTTNIDTVVTNENANSNNYKQSITAWHNNDGTRYRDNGSQSNSNTYKSAREVAPTGYAKVRIDCETPGASILYGVSSQTPATAGTKIHPDAGGTDYESKYDNKGKYSETSNIAKSSIVDPSKNYTQGNWIFIGDGQYTSARKDYVSAKATVSSMMDSEKGYEGVFKTVVHYIKNTNSQVQIQGGTFNGGMPSIPGFPLRDAIIGWDSRMYNQNTYKKDNSNYYWLTYEIVSEYSILSVNGGTKWSTIYSYGEYGQISTLSGINHS